MGPEIFDQDRAKDCTTTTTMDIYHTRHPPHKGTIRITKNTGIRISRTKRITGTMRTADHKDHKDKGAIP